MRVVEVYSHLNGQEHILVHKPQIWNELCHVIEIIDAGTCKTKVSKERTMHGKMLYSPENLNKRFRDELNRRGWHESRTSYWVTSDIELIRKTVHLPPDKQKFLIEESGGSASYSYNQTDFVKERVAIEVQFGKYSFVAYDLFVKHMAFYVANEIDVGIEILPMKELSKEMSSGIGYYESEIYNVIRQGRGIPAVPLVILGVAP